MKPNETKVDLEAPGTDLLSELDALANACQPGQPEAFTEYVMGLVNAYPALAAEIRRLREENEALEISVPSAETIKHWLGLEAERDQLAADNLRLSKRLEELTSKLEKAEAVCEAVSNWDPWGNLEISDSLEAWRRAHEEREK